MRNGAHLLFAVRIALPDVQVMTRTGDDGQVMAWLHDDASSSWATLAGGEKTVYPGGPRDLAAELGHAWEHWIAHGRPGFHDFGMTVFSPQPHEQTVWCRNPETGPYWPTPAGRSARPAQP